MHCSYAIRRLASVLLVGCCAVSSGCASDRAGRNGSPAIDPVTTRSVQSQDRNSSAVETAGERKFPKRESRLLSLQEALTMAADYSWTMQIAQGELDIADSRVSQARAKYYPVVSAEVNAPTVRHDGGIDGRDRDFEDVAYAGIDVRYNIYDFGRRKSENLVAEHNLRASSHAKRAEDLTVLFDTATAYLAVQSYNEQMNAASQYVHKIQALNQTIGESVAGGISPQSDAVRGRLALSNAINRRKNIELSLSRARQRLNALVGIDVNVMQPKRVALPRVKGLESVAVVAADENPAVLARGAALDGSMENVVGAKADRLPRLDLSVDYKRALESVDDLYDVSSTDGGVKLKLTFDIFDMSKKGKISEAYAQVNVAKAQLGKERATIEDQVRALLGDIDITAQQWAISQEASFEADKTRGLYLEEFRLGDRKLSDLISAETEYFTAHTDAIDARYGFIRYVFSIYYLAGKPRDGLVALQLLEQ